MNGDLERLYTDLQFAGKLSPGLVKALRRLVHYIQQAADERDFCSMKSLHDEKLDDAGTHSMRLNDQFRLVLRFVGHAPRKVVLIQSVEDYH